MTWGLGSLVTMQNFLQGTGVRPVTLIFSDRLDGSAVKTGKLGSRLLLVSMLDRDRIGWQIESLSRCKIRVYECRPVGENLFLAT